MKKTIFLAALLMLATPAAFAERAPAEDARSGLNWQAFRNIFVQNLSDDDLDDRCENKDVGYVRGGTNAGCSYKCVSHAWSLITCTVGAATNSFTTVDAPSGTDPAADSATDTLALTAGTGLSITGDSSTDTLAFALTTVPLANGGTNQTSWTASRCVRVNAGGTALESATADCGSGGGGGGSTASLVVGTVIAQGSVSGSDNTTLFDQASISGSYDHIVIRMMLRSDRASFSESNAAIRFNNDTTDANYREQWFRVNTVPALVFEEFDDSVICRIPAASSASGDFGHCDVEIYQYASTAFTKTASARSGFRRSNSGGTQIIQAITTLNWESTSAINRISVVESTGNKFKVGSWYEVIGYKAVTVSTP